MGIPIAALSLARQCELSGLPMPVEEFRFHSVRRWRFDYAFIAQRLAVEIDGGGFVNGRHSRGSGIEKDCEKLAEALALGWRVLRVTPKHVKSGQALTWITRLLAQDGIDVVIR